MAVALFVAMKRTAITVGVVSALGLATLIGPTEARACYYGGCDFGGLIAPVAAGTVAGLVTLGVLGLDLSLALRGQRQSTDIAIVNLLLGLADLGAGVALALLDSDALVGFGAGLIGAGSVMVVDGAVGLVLGPGDSRAPPLGVAVDAGPGRLVVSVGARF